MVTLNSSWWFLLQFVWWVVCVGTEAPLKRGRNQNLVDYSLFLGDIQWPDCEIYKLEWWLFVCSIFHYGVALPFVFYFVKLLLHFKWGKTWQCFIPAASDDQWAISQPPTSFDDQLTASSELIAWDEEIMADESFRLRGRATNSQWGASTTIFFRSRNLVDTTEIQLSSLTKNLSSSLKFG